MVQTTLQHWFDKKPKPKSKQTGKNSRNYQAKIVFTTKDCQSESHAHRVTPPGLDLDASVSDENRGTSTSTSLLRRFYASNAQKALKQGDGDGDGDGDDEDDCCIIEPPVESPVLAQVPVDVQVQVQVPSVEGVATPKSTEVANLGTTDDNDDDEIEIVGSTGQNALADFPHCRRDCVKHIFQPYSSSINWQHCSNCYCWVCDEPAKTCSSWVSHCMADPSDSYWKSQRRLGRQGKPTSSEPPPLFFSPVGSLHQSFLARFLNASSQLSRPPTRPRRSATKVPRSRQAVRARPVRSTTSTSTTARLVSPRKTPTPKARPVPAPVAPLEASIPQTSTDVSDGSIQGILKQLTTKKDSYHRRATPSAHKFVSNLYNYQKESLAFLEDVETRPSCQGKGGWLASDVGMGKTAIILALIASDTKRLSLPSPSHLQATVVLTSVSLMGQWEDEAQKHAPGLKVYRFHPASRSRNPIHLDDPNPLTLKKLSSADIILSTATFEWPELISHGYTFRRLVMDEAHLLSNSRTANIQYAMKIKARHKWCVTATPFRTSLSDLKDQLRFLEFSAQDSVQMTWSMATSSGRANNDNDANVRHFLQELKRCLIRHDKSQLTMPTSTTSVVTVPLNNREQQEFKRALSASRNKLDEYQQSGVNTFPLEQAVLHPLCTDSFLTSDWRESSKIEALLREFKILQKKDLNLRAVVFTQYSNTHKQVVQALKQFFGIPVVYQITGSTSATNRDFAIRAFQGPKTFPAVLVVTLRAGSVGMTLTAASSLYLMEPSIDPAAEIQAMGRIHRIGQDQNVKITKFVSASSVESNLITFHEKLQDGSLKIQANMVPPEGVRILTQGLL
jgi:superfamily II DNA or RNA helicase